MGVNTKYLRPEKPRQPRQPCVRQKFPDPADFAKPFFSTRTTLSADGTKEEWAGARSPRRHSVFEAGMNPGEGVPDRCESTPRDLDESMSMPLTC